MSSRKYFRVRLAVGYVLLALLLCLLLPGTGAADDGAPQVKRRTPAVEPVGPAAPAQPAAPVAPRIRLSSCEMRRMDSPLVGTQRDLLQGVAAVAPDNVWAVGSSDQHTLILHWNGQAWATVASPRIGDRSFLSGVAAATTSDAWAVGAYDTSSGQQALVVRWNGSAWTRVTLPTIGGSSSLQSVASVSTTDAWAVGQFSETGDPNAQRPLILHWNGTDWRQVAAPTLDAPSYALHGVAALAPNNAWAVGTTLFETLILHWDGVAWTRVDSPNPGTGPLELTGIAAVAANDIWAVGSSRDPMTIATETLTFHWDGAEWSHVPSPNIPSSSHLNPATQLNAVVAVAPNNVWAVGWYANRWYASQTLAMRWDGSQWTIVPSDNVGPLQAIAAVGGMDVWAVGSQWSTDPDSARTLIQRVHTPCP